MTREEIRKAIIDILADIAPDEDTSGLKDDVGLRDQLGLDSMDFLDIVMELRKRYNVEVPSPDYPQLATMTSCLNYLSPKMA
ncbi:MAG: acyl carrier protein [Candidatus Wallbacteria bacterium]|nr:acyl carrier protein [Candidatus Wallbacteria bacterium]